MHSYVFVDKPKRQKKISNDVTQKEKVYDKWKKNLYNFFPLNDIIRNIFHGTFGFIVLFS